MNALRISREDLESDSDTDFDKADAREPLDDLTNQQIPARARNTLKTQPRSYDQFQEEPSGYHQPQIIDEDVENFTTRLDMAIVKFRSETVGDFMKIKRHLLQEQAETIAREKAKCEAILAAKQNEVESLKEMLARVTGCSEKFERQTQALGGYGGKLRKTLRAQNCIHRAVIAWKLWAKRHSGNKQRVLNFCGRRQLLDLKIVFAAWAREHRKNVNNIRDEKCDKRVRDKASELSMRYGKEVEQLRAKLDETQAMLDHERRNKLSMVDELKKSWMRQMCAFNYDSMHILGGQQPPSMSASMSVAPSDFNYSATPSRAAIETPPQLTPSSHYQMSDPSTQIPTESVVGGRDILEKGESMLESKDHKWQPAPIHGHTLTGGTFGRNNNPVMSSNPGFPQTMTMPQEMMMAQQTQPAVMTPAGPGGFNAMKNLLEGATTTNTDLHTASVEELMDRYRPAQAPPPMPEKPPATAPYEATIEVDNAVCGGGGVASSLPQVNASASAGKTIRVNAGGKSYVEGGMKKVSTTTIGAAARTSKVVRPGTAKKRI